MTRLLWTACLATGCLDASEIEDNDPDVASVASVTSDIINGTIMPTDNSGMVWIRSSRGWCSGTLLTNHWVLSAKRCFSANDVASPWTVSLGMPPQARGAIQIQLHPSQDVALLRSSSAFTMNGSTTGYQALIYPYPTSTHAQGTPMRCLGYGATSSRGTDFGTLREVFLPVRGTNFTWWFNGFDLGLNANSGGGFISSGDLGGSCQGITPYGESTIAGVMVSIYDNFDGKIVNVVSADNFRTWAQSYVTPSADLTVNSSGAPPYAVPVLGDFDGDGLSDFVVWNPANGVWSIVTRTWRQLPNQQWGMWGDIPVSGDFDGDRRADHAIWRPSDGMWWVLDSSTRAYRTRQFGMRGDIPVPGDYDGDGRTDFAIWRPSDGMWWVVNSSTGAIQTRQWGQWGDKPVSADYDRDGRADFAIWRPSTGTWWIIGSYNQQIYGQQWGASDDIPLTGYIGCSSPFGQAVWRPWSGAFWINGRRDGHALGQRGDIPMFGNFDNVGAPDLVVYRPSNATWYVEYNAVGCF